MANKNRTEKDIWNQVKALMGDKKIRLGKHWAFNLYNDPKRLSFVLSRYKFAAKMIAKNKSILELGCSEGIGVPILAEFAKEYAGVDMDESAIETAKQNWSTKAICFKQEDFIGKTYGRFDAVVSLDVVEHIDRSHEHEFFNAISRNIKKDGIAVVGTPNVTAFKFASRPSKLGHVNMFDHTRLKKTMQKIFKNVFIFGINDEIVHTGFLPMAHYLICLGYGKRRKNNDK